MRWPVGIIVALAVSFTSHFLLAYFFGTAKTIAYIVAGFTYALVTMACWREIKFTSVLVTTGLFAAVVLMAACVPSAQDEAPYLFLSLLSSLAMSLLVLAGLPLFTVEVPETPDAGGGPATNYRTPNWVFFNAARAKYATHRPTFRTREVLTHDLPTPRWVWAIVFAFTVITSLVCWRIVDPQTTGTVTRFFARWGWIWIRAAMNGLLVLAAGTAFIFAFAYSIRAIQWIVTKAGGVMRGMSARAKARSLVVAACVTAVLLFGVFVWPTRYQTETYHTGLYLVVVKTDRITGEVTAKAVVPKVEHAKKLDAD